MTPSILEDNDELILQQSAIDIRFYHDPEDVDMTYEFDLLMETLNEYVSILKPNRRMSGVDVNYVRNAGLACMLALQQLKTYGLEIVAVRAAVQAIDFARLEAFRHDMRLPRPIAEVALDTTAVV